MNFVLSDTSIVVGLITSTVNSTRRHACEIYNNLKLLRLVYIGFDHPTFNNNLKQLINIAQSSKRLVLGSSDNNKFSYQNN